MSQSQQLLKINQNRKEKSLEEVTKRFMQLLLEQNQQQTTLELICRHLSVERRRIYDIINIMESVHLIVRRQKHVIRFQGIDYLQRYIKCIQQQTPTELCEQARPSRCKQKQLEYLSSGFIAMFQKHNYIAITLEQAASELSAANISQLRLKTKVRRLYDIANVFKSIGLISKIRQASHKPAYKWVGIQGILQFVQELLKDNPTLLAFHQKLIQDSKNLTIQQHSILLLQQQQQIVLQQQQQLQLQKQIRIQKQQQELKIKLQQDQIIKQQSQQQIIQTEQKSKSILSYQSQPLLLSQQKQSLILQSQSQLQLLQQQQLQYQQQQQQQQQQLQLQQQQQQQLKQQNQKQIVNNTDWIKEFINTIKQKNLQNQDQKKQNVEQKPIIIQQFQQEQEIQLKLQSPTLKYSENINNSCSNENQQQSSESSKFNMEQNDFKRKSFDSSFQFMSQQSNFKKRQIEKSEEFPKFSFKSLY